MAKLGELDPNNEIAEQGDITLNSGKSIQSIIDAGTLTVDVNNWNPTGFALADMIGVDINSNNRAITGMVAPPAGQNRIVGIRNKNTGSNDLRFSHNNAASAAPNRFLCRDNGNRSIKPNETALWWYSHADQRWVPYGRIG